MRALDVDGAAGALRARHYAPRALEDRDAAPRPPLTVYLHGGGFVIGDLDTHDEPCRMLCRYADTHVLSVAYRLAPEHPFPAAVDDAQAAFAWARAHAASLGADPDRVAVGGDSAGANLGAVVSAAAPPTLVVIAGFDPLRDDGEAYAAALERAGARVRVLRFPSLAHGFIHMTGVVPAALSAVRAIAHQWRALLPPAIKNQGIWN